MPYCSLAQIQVRIGAITPSLSGPKADVFAAMVAEAQVSAQSDIDFALSRKYQVPFADADVPPGISQIAADLAAAFCIRASFSGGGEDAEPKLALVYEERANRKLEKLAKEEDTVPDATIAQAELAQSVAYHTTANRGDCQRGGLLSELPGITSIPGWHPQPDDTSKIEGFQW